MKYRFHTRSAAMYIIDTDEMTWERRRPDPKTPEHIIGLEESSGKLSAAPIIQVGMRGILMLPMQHMSDPSYIATTVVERIELLDD